MLTSQNFTSTLRWFEAFQLVGAQKLGNLCKAKSGQQSIHFNKQEDINNAGWERVKWNGVDEKLLESSISSPVPWLGSTCLASAMMGMTRLLMKGCSTNLPIRWVYLASSGWTAKAVSPSIVSRRVVATGTLPCLERKKDKSGFNVWCSAKRCKKRRHSGALGRF